MDIDPTKIDLLGHYAHPRTLGHLCGELTRRRGFHQERDAERVAEGKESMADMLSSFLHTSVDCYRCGRSISLLWSGIDGEAPTVGMQFLRPEEWEEDYRPLSVPDDTPCPVPECLPITVRFTCKSGRIAMGNDFRKYHTDRRQEKGHQFSICSHSGKDAYIKWHAEHGYLTGFVGNTCVWFVPKDGGLDVVFPGEGFEDDSEYDRLEEVCIHQVSTELWWFAIVDAADLPKGATDSYDREIGFMDLPPGEYEATIQPETSRGSVVSTIRPVVA